MQEYNSSNIKCQLEQILTCPDTTHMILFTFDTGSKATFKHYLKKSVKELIFLIEGSSGDKKLPRTLPIMLVGIDITAAPANEGVKNDVLKLKEVLNKHG